MNEGLLFSSQSFIPFFHYHLLFDQYPKLRHLFSSFCLQLLCYWMHWCRLSSYWFCWSINWYLLTIVLIFLL